MDNTSPQTQLEPSADEAAVRTLYSDLLRRWNMRDANGFAAYFAEDGAIVGFDGTVVEGRAEIGSHLGEIFASHQTPAYVQVIKSVRFLSEDIALARAIVGMPSVMTATINPTLNSIQWLTAVRHDGAWRVALLQNTPAQFHGRPEALQQMTAELQRHLERAD